MTHLYPIPNTNALYLYTNEHQILLRARTNGGMTRPILLASDYAGGLCDTLFQGMFAVFHTLFQGIFAAFYTLFQGVFTAFYTLFQGVHAAKVQKYLS